MDYKPDYNGMRDLLVGPGVRSALRQAAQRVANYARAEAPTGKPPDDKHPGAYRASIHLEDATSFRGTRARVDVVADVPYANKIEGKYHVLSRALDAAKGFD